MTTFTHLLITSPKWHVYKGYAYGLPQSSMSTFERFPSGTAATATTTAFLELIGRMVQDSTTAAAPVVDPDLTGDVATASALAAATACVQTFLQLPVAPDFRVRTLRGPRQDGRLNLLLPFWQAAATKSAYSFCSELWNRIATGEEFDEIRPLNESLAARLSPFVSKRVNEFALVKGVTELGINLVRLPGDVLCLGTGSRSRWMFTTLTDATPRIGINIARNKLHTAAILRLAGLPGAENRLVTDLESAVAVAAEFGGPVVVKPIDRDRGDGVAADLRNEAEVRAAYDAARSISEAVMVEKMIPGYTHRLTVAAGEVISVRQRVPGGVTGNGRSTIADLIKDVQNDNQSLNWQRRRGRPRIALDEEALSLMGRDGHGPDTILPEGQFLRLRRRDNINAGGTNKDIDLSEVHRDNLELAVAAANALRLDIAGIDLITSDITRSWREVGAGICEVNGGPQFASTRTPEIFRKVIARVTGPDPHVPANLILCTDDPAERAAVVELAKTRAPHRTVSTREGLWRGGAALTQAFPSGYAAAIAAITRQDTEAMTCVMSLRELLGGGSPLRRWAHISIREAKLNEAERVLLPVARALLATATTHRPADADQNS